MGIKFLLLQGGLQLLARNPIGDFSEFSEGIARKQRALRDLALLYPPSPSPILFCLKTQLHSRHPCLGPLC